MPEDEHLGIRGISSVLLGVLAIALILRVWGITHGLPYIYNPDENFEVYRALRLGTGELDLTRMTKGGYFYLLFVEFGVYYAILRISGSVGSALEFARSFLDDPSALWMIGRITTAVIGTINVFVVYMIGRRAAGAAVATCSAFILAVAYYPVVHSHYISVDVPMTCLASIALYYAIRILHSGQLGFYVKAGIFAGLAAVTKLPGVLVFAPIVVAHFLHAGEHSRRDWRRTTIKHLGTSFASFAVIYVVLNPGILWKSGTMLLFILGQFAGTGWAQDLPPEMRVQQNTWLFYLDALAEGVGIGIAICGALGLVAALFRRNRAIVVLSTFVLVFYVVISMSRDPNLVYGRYILPMIPAGVVLAGYAIVKLVALLRLPRVYESVAITVVLLALTYPSVTRSVTFGDVHSRKDTRTLAKEWIDANIPPGSKVFMEGNPEENSQLTIPLESTVANLLQMAEQREEDDPGKAYYLRLRAELAKQPAYDLVTAQMHELWPSWETCRDLGVEFVVLRHRFRGFSAELPTAGIPRSRAAFDLDLNSDPSVTMLTSFDPAESRSPGPYVRIYEVRTE